MTVNLKIKFFLQLPESLVCREIIDGARLLELKKFTATLITVAMEYQQILEA